MCVCVCVCVGVRALSRFNLVRLFVTLWTVAYQVPLSMGFSRQKYWSGLPCPHPGDLPDLGIESMSLMNSALAGRFFTTVDMWKAFYTYIHASVQFNCSVVSDCLRPHGIQHARLPCPSPAPGVELA